jgi:hypothetical protein
VVERQVTHLAQLVDDLLDVSRITQGKISLKKEPVELGKGHPAQHRHRAHAARREAPPPCVNVSAAPIWVYGDFARLSQVIGNILNNAAKYTSEGGKIELSASAERGEALISVRDNGIGIDAALLPHVFELFTQGERSLDRSQGGLGRRPHRGRAASSTCTRAASRCTATASARARCSASSFPASAKCRSRRARSAPWPPSPRCRPARGVLVIDDNIDAAESIAVYLRLEGHEVRTVSDGPQAVAIAQVFAPQVAVVDIGLPGMNGYEVARRLQLKGSVGADAAHRAHRLRTEGRPRALDPGGIPSPLREAADPRIIQAAISSWRATRRTAL